MKNKIIITLLILLLPSILISSSFYTNLYNEGKKLYLKGNFEEAVENFRIAEFGLIENVKIMKELYLYYALSHFKLNHGDEVVKIVDKLKEVWNTDKFENIKNPEELKNDLNQLFSAVDSSYKKQITKKENANIASNKITSKSNEKKYNELYDKVRSDLKNNDLKAVKKGLKRLKKLNKYNLKTRLISGIVSFQENNYKKTIDELLILCKTGKDELVNEASYYLALSNYFLKKYGQFLAFSQKINDEDINTKLKDITEKVKRIREEKISLIKDNFFSKKNCKNFVESFNGDISLAGDIFSKVKGLKDIRTRDIYYMGKIFVKYPGVYNKGFILEISDFFKGKEQEEYAAEIIENSKFYKDDNENNIKVLYELGIIYDLMGEKRKAKKIMMRVKSIDPGYKKVDFYLTK